MNIIITILLPEMSAALKLTTDSTTLDELEVGERARVLHVQGDESIRRRLLEMGMCGGVGVEVIRRASFGGPIELRVRGYHLSLRAEQASMVCVRTEG